MNASLEFELRTVWVLAIGRHQRRRRFALPAATTIAATAETAAREKGVGAQARTAAICPRPSKDFGGTVVDAVAVSGDTPQVDEAIAIAGALR